MLFRVLSHAGLAVAAVVVPLAAFLLFTASYFLVDPVNVPPVAIYHNTWQAVKDNIYDQSLLKDWDSWEHKFDDKIKTEADAIQYAAEMVNSLGDPYTRLQDAASVREEYRNAEANFVGVGIVFERLLDGNGQQIVRPDGQSLALSSEGCPVIERPLLGSPAEKAGIAAGDILMSINGKPCTGLSIDQLTSELRGEAGTNVTILVKRHGQVMAVDLTRSALQVPTVSTARLANGIGYLRITGFDQLDTADEVEAALLNLKDCKALIVDVRDNPGGLVHTAFQTAALFMDRGHIATEEVRVPGAGYLSYKLELTPSIMWMRVGGVPIPLPRPANLTGNKPVLVLVNDGTASAAETFAAALKDNGRATVIGTRTFGKGIGQTLVPVGNGARVRVTNFRGFTPSGSWIGDGNNVRFGIEPDVKVAPHPHLVFGFKTDNQLQQAVEHLQQVVP